MALWGKVICGGIGAAIGGPIGAGIGVAFIGTGEKMGAEFEDNFSHDELLEAANQLGGGIELEKPLQRP